jgi:lipoprotein NlpI
MSPSFSDSGIDRGSPPTPGQRPCLALILLILVPVLACAIQNPGAILDRAVADFEAGRVRDSAEGFDQVARLVPDLAPQLWQRGIALYYAGRYQDCREQFESHRRVNPDDVENAAWHFLCVARIESPEAAREALLPVGPDSRRALPEIYDMYRGTLTPDQVLDVAGNDPFARFYADLYIGLYLEAIGNADRAAPYLRAAKGNMSASGLYMHMVARVHIDLRGLDR